MHLCAQCTKGLELAMLGTASLPFLIIARIAVNLIAIVSETPHDYIDSLQDQYSRAWENIGVVPERPITMQDAIHQDHLGNHLLWAPDPHPPYETAEPIVQPLVAPEHTERASSQRK